jgi:hypothetical protein
VSKRISSGERLRAQIDAVVADGQGMSRAIERVAHLGAQLLLQSAQEAEVATACGIPGLVQAQAPPSLLERRPSTIASAWR